MPAIRLLLATRNAGKVREIRQMVTGTPLTWHSLDDYPDVPDAVESGTTFAENARLKALHYAAATGLDTLADDSGLIVDALDGAPGVQSARYAGTPRDDDANNRKLVQALQNVPPDQRTARFRCAMALVRDGTVALESSGAVEGIIIDQPRGTNGFGYDPHFVVEDTERTAAELPAEEKNSRSHRGRALRNMLKQIETLYRELGLWQA